MKFEGNKIRIAFIMGNAVMTKAFMIAAGWYFGSKLDKKFGTSPYIMVSLVVLAMAFGIWYLLHIAKKNNLTE